MNTGPFSIGTIILGGAAVALAGVLLLGVVLPASWEAEAATRVEADPETVFAFLDSPEGWRQWTPWPDSGVVRSGPSRGSGATLAWDDQELGQGSFTIVEAEGLSLVRYEVEVSGGAMHTQGSFELSREGTGTRVSWHESGDLGRNPLMGYWAFFMQRAQTRELEKSLARLVTLAAGGPSPEYEAPTDTMSTGEVR